MTKSLVDFSKNFLRVDEENAKKTSVLVRAHTCKVCNQTKRKVFCSIFPSKINQNDME